ncbi:MAG: GNAT family N-acetyltransferase [Coriobacteriia bacterium]|nr:GNAT family N-acetyltransferase [Coriobacteriia bacterium]
MRIRRLQPDDERSGFSCGDPDFDDFIRKYAGQYQFRHHVGVTIVAVDDERVVGYATVVPGSVDGDELSELERRRLPKHPVPVLRLARLAVDSRYQGRGLGRRLVREVLLVALRMRTDLGCTAVIVDALKSRASFYEGLGFEPMVPLQGRPRVAGATAMFLPLRRIAGAAQGTETG